MIGTEEKKAGHSSPAGLDGQETGRVRRSMWSGQGGRKGAMNTRIVALFAREEDLLGAARTARRSGLKTVDAYTPYPVHGLEDAMGLRRSRLTWVCFALGLAGAGFMCWFQFWTSAIDWPVNIGGKPWNSLPAFVPVIFEGMVLTAGVGTTVVFLLISRLLPGLSPSLSIPEVTNDRFALLLEEAGGNFTVEALSKLFSQQHPVEIINAETFLPAASKSPDGKTGLGRYQGRINLVLFVLLLMVSGLTWALRSDRKQPNWEFLPDMMASVPSNAYAKNKVFADGKTLQAPVPGSIARGDMPLHFKATKEDAVRAGLELNSPLAPDNAKALERGSVVFMNFCTACHGGDGKGMGPVPKRGFPPPPSLLNGNSLSMKDGQLFHILTFGQGNMPGHARQISPEDRWNVILYVRSLQAEAATPSGEKK